ncbi:hypothetical protein RJT34_25636 [Clitoria ternatea]|uniref:TF-B3 domain-containing protein n=1 Tax=Clitoria ternatea TaxID=43366 RepID=A0AAN9FQ61_CLITE
MAPHHRKRDGNLPIRFFKIILKANLGILKIPNKFTRRYGSGLPNPVFIKPPDGTEWEVHWTKRNGEVWFEKGWKEFVENYPLDHGHLVVFKYEGTSQMDVLILDQSSTEIDYPFSDTNDENDNLDPNQSDDNSVTILDEWPNQKARKMRGEKAARSSSSLNWPRLSRAQEIAKEFISDNPFFTVTINPSNFKGNYLGLPNLKGCIENKEKSVVLQIGEQSWYVKLLPAQPPLRWGRFSAGWSLFATESKLQSGDVCVFELISSQDPVFKVYIFKAQS